MPPSGGGWRGGAPGGRGAAAETDPRPRPAPGAVAAAGGLRNAPAGPSMVQAVGIGNRFVG